MELDKLKQLGKELGEVASSVTDALEDKKISLMESIGIAKEIGGLSFFAIKNRDILVQSFKVGLSEEGSNVLHEGFCEGFNPKCETTEASVELMFNAMTMIAVGISMLLVDTDKAEEIMTVVEDEPVNEDTVVAENTTSGEDTPSLDEPNDGVEHKDEAPAV